jgi:hypothetical protein
MLKLSIKRLAMTLIEVLLESLLLGTLFCLLVAPTQYNSLLATVISPLPVILVLFLYGYYFTRPLVGLFWRPDPAWAYALRAAALFAVHMGIAIVRLRPDISPEARSVTIPFLIGGTAIVFCCAWFGSRLLLRWINPRRRTPDSPALTNIGNDERYDGAVS